MNLNKIFRPLLSSGPPASFSSSASCNGKGKRNFIFAFDLDEGIKQKMVKLNENYVA